MRKLVVCALLQTKNGDQIKEDEMDWTCSTHQDCKMRISYTNTEEQKPLRGLGVEKRIILK
jgi:hypothetical protein